MSNLFECKIKYEILNEKTHKLLLRTKKCVINAPNQEEAEKFLQNSAAFKLCLNPQIKSIKELKNTSLVFDEKGGSWYKLKIIYRNQGYKSGVIFIQAYDVEGVLNNIKAYLKLPSSDYSINLIEKSSIEVIWNETDGFKEILKFEADSELLKRLMARLQLTQNQLAKEMGVPSATLVHIISGKKALNKTLLEKLLEVIQKRKAEYLESDTGDPA